MDRRTMIVSLALSSLAAPLAARVARAAASETESMDLLFVQSAHKATLADGVLKLSGISPSTIVFSDRPGRFAGHIPTDVFNAHWSAGKNSFESDPPNATLSIADPSVPDEIVVVLKNPRLAGEDLTYDVEVLEGAQSVEGGPVSLFIDIVGRPWTPASYAGVGRRVRRRTWRRRAVYGPW